MVTVGEVRIAGDEPVCEDCALLQSNRRESFMAQQISPLRQRMTDDMTIRNMAPNTQRAYIRAVRSFTFPITLLGRADEVIE